MMAELAVYESDAFPQNTMRLDACLTTDQTQYTVYNSKGQQTAVSFSTPGKVGHA